MRQRKCKDCGVDISSRYIKAQRCCDCAVKRQQRLANRRRRQARRAATMVEIETDYAEVEQQADDNKRGKSAADDNKRGKSAADDSKQRVCPECGAEFRPLHGSQVCCSDECKRNRLRMKWRESKRCNARIRKLSPHQRMLANLRRRDALAPKPKTEIIERNGIVIERRGTVPAGANAVGIIKHT